MSGDYREADTFERLGRGAARPRASSGRSSTWPSRRRCSTTSSRAWPASGSPRAPGSSSRSRSAATSTSARELNDVLHRGLPRGPRLPHRPLPRQGVGREPARVPVRQLDARADLEPQLHHVGADHDGRGVRRRRAAASSTTRSARSATSCRTTCSRSSPCSPWSRRSAADADGAARREGEGVPPDRDASTRRRRRAGPVPRLRRRGRRRTAAPTPRPSSPSASRSSRGGGPACRG